MSPTQPARRLTPAQLKVARQKKILIGGSIFLVVLLAVLGPHTLKQFHHSQGNPIPASMRGIPPASTQPAAPAAVEPTGLSDTDVVTVQPGSGQLVSFSLFKSKDPFVQQLASATPAASSTPSAATAVPARPAASKQTVTVPAVVSTPSAPTPVRTTPATTVTPTVSTPAATTPAPSPTPTTTAPQPVVPTPTSAAISTNGHCEIVEAKATFPKSDPVFQLVSVAPNGASVKIGVAGGSYQSGAATVTLKRGTPLTLVNTADGVRYRLSLLTACPATPAGTSAKASSSTTTATTTTAAATTAPSTTVSTPTTPTSTTKP